MRSVPAGTCGIVTVELAATMTSADVASALTTPTTTVWTAPTDWALVIASTNALPPVPAHSSLNWPVAPLRMWSETLWALR